MAIFSYQCLEAASLVSDVLFVLCRVIRTCHHVVSCITDTTFSLYTYTYI
jgi:hypothetical protein